MTEWTDDPRLLPATWSAGHDGRRRRRLALLVLANLGLAVWYFSWLFQPGRVGNIYLYGLLVAAELFNLFQAAGFWWTASADRSMDEPTGALTDDVPVDVFIPTYGEPIAIVEPVLSAATRMRGATVHVYLMDDGPDPAKRELAERYGATYVTRADRSGAKAGSINNALAWSASPYVVVFDADHVPDLRFLEATLGHFADDRVAFVQTPQYYANGSEPGVASGAWSQQALFFGAIARGKDGLGAMFCCGTNVVFRRAALESIGGFPVRSLTEDFELSIALHELGWRSAYVPEVLASGLGPEDMASYVGQQQRWARGCLGAFPRILRARLPAKLRLQYLLSSMFFLSGWTFLIYMAFPVVRLLFGLQPVSAASADRFVLHFVPYFAGALSAVAIAGGGVYTFRGFALLASIFWVHIRACLHALLGVRGRFVVTPKSGERKVQIRPVLPTLLAIAALVGASIVGLLRDIGPATLNNVSFAALHVAVLSAGVWPALRPPAASSEDALEEVETHADLALEPS